MAAATKLLVECRGGFSTRGSLNLREMRGSSESFVEGENVVASFIRMKAFFRRRETLDGRLVGSI